VDVGVDAGVDTGSFQQAGGQQGGDVGAVLDALAEEARAGVPPCASRPGDGVPPDNEAPPAVPPPKSPAAAPRRKRGREREGDTPPIGLFFEIPWKRAFRNWQQVYGLAGPSDKEALLADFREAIGQEDRRLADAPDAVLAALLRGEIKVEPVEDAEAIRFRLPAFS
jgi:hypothetical protein